MALESRTGDRPPDRRVSTQDDFALSDKDLAKWLARKAGLRPLVRSVPALHGFATAAIIGPPFADPQLWICPAMGFRWDVVARGSNKDYQVLATVSHDLQNPLQTIMLAAAMAEHQLQGPPGEPLRKQMDVIRRAVQRMTRLIRDLLDAALIEAGQLRIEPRAASARELLARMRAILRRLTVVDEGEDRVLSGGRVTLDLDRHTVAVDGEEISMPLKEFELLELLMRNAGRVLTRGQLIDRVWGSDYFGDTKTLDVHVKRIRSRIEPVPSAPVSLVTVRGLGYRFEG